MADLGSIGEDSLEGLGPLTYTIAGVDELLATENTLAYPLAGVENSLDNEGGGTILLGVASLTFSATGLLVDSSATPMVGIAAIVFGDSSTLTGIGVLAGDADLVFGDNSTLSSVGVLAGTSGIVFGDNSTLTATGALAGAGMIVFGDNSTLTATGVLVGYADLVFDGRGHLTNGSVPPALLTWRIISPKQPSCRSLDFTTNIRRVGSNPCRNRTPI